VHTVSRTVSIGKSEWLIASDPLIRKGRCIVQNLEKMETRYAGMLAGKLHFHWFLTDKIRDFCDRRIEIFAIPTIWKEDLGAKATWAIVVREAIGLRLASVKTRKVHGFGVVASREVTLEWVASEHTKASRKASNFALGSPR
jgi:hypothetical protein